MAAGNVGDILRNPGRVVVNPTNLSNAYPYGGSEIGKTRGVVLQPLGSGFRIEAEGLGEATDVLESRIEYVVGFVLRGWDKSALQLLFSGGYAAGAVSQRPVWSEPGNVTPGQSAYSRGVSLLFVPDDPVNVPALLVYHGVPGWPEGVEVALQRGEEFAFAVALDCLRDSNGNILAVGILADLSLT